MIHYKNNIAIKIPKAFGLQIPADISGLITDFKVSMEQHSEELKKTEAYLDMEKRKAAYNSITSNHNIVFSKPRPGLKTFFEYQNEYYKASAARPDKIYAINADMPDFFNDFRNELRIFTCNLDFLR